MPTARSRTARKPSKSAQSSSGLTPRTFAGLSKKRMAQKGGGGGNRIQFSTDNPTSTIQFLQKPEDMREYYIHSFQEDGRWHFVPCAGKDDCPLCESESERVRAINYRFAANVIDLKSGQVRILEGPKTLASAIYYRYQRKPAVFLKRVYDVTRFPTQPVSYNFELAEEDPVSVRGKKLIDFDEYLVNEMKSYYGDDLDITPADLSDDEDEPEDDEDLDEEEDDEELDDDEDEDEEDEDDWDDDDEDEDDEDWDDEDDDEDDDEEEEPPRRARTVAKKASARKAVAKKAAPRKAAAAKATPRKTTARKRG